MCRMRFHRIERGERCLGGRCASAIGVASEQVVRVVRRYLGFTPADLLDDLHAARELSVER